MVAVQAATRLYVVHIHGVVGSRLSSTARRVDVFARNTRTACALAYAGLVSHISSYIFASFDCITSAPHRLRSHASRIYSSATDSLVRHTLPFIRYHSLSSILAVVDDVKNDTSFTIRKATSTLAFILAVYANVKNVISSFINATFNLPLILAISDYIKNLFSSSTTAICALRPQEELTISLSLPSFRLSLVSSLFFFRGRRYNLTAFLSPRVKTYNACGVCTDTPVLVARALARPKIRHTVCDHHCTLSPPRPSTKTYASRSACTDAPECRCPHLPTVATIVAPK
ncbi:hypothetical protein BD626DRAFT_214376 [Schizophyllum amplum]|uniref:Uncharacterized protein n=1 Tax=Schizophyllum amplum TaxID=97359 RepID=A0A550CK24_9AGAR|nr:hypothetical protein BD626DRAFT_214376 [Auriculariopsis ampla]